MKRRGNLKQTVLQTLWYVFLAAVIALMVSIQCVAWAQEVVGSGQWAVSPLAPRPSPLNLPPVEQRLRFRNHDGSCVQCTLGMAGVHQNVPAAEWLLWNSAHGSAVRGSSGPTRVRNYCDTRGIAAWSVTGKSWPWIEWALRTGRTAAVTYGRNHMLWAVGISRDGRQVAICDNDSPQRVRWVSRSTFLQQHRLCNQGWAVILQAPPPPGTPELVRWWE